MPELDNEQRRRGSGGARRTKDFKAVTDTRGRAPAFGAQSRFARERGVSLVAVASGLRSGSLYVGDDGAVIEAEGFKSLELTPMPPVDPMIGEARVEIDGEIEDWLDEGQFIAGLIAQWPKRQHERPPLAFIEALKLLRSRFSAVIEEYEDWQQAIEACAEMGGDHE